MDGAEAISLLATASAGATAVGTAILGLLGIPLAFRMARRIFS